MARIRSIKPTFWSDGGMLRLSDSTALFYISLWNFADDYGYLPLDIEEITARCVRFRKEDVTRMLASLFNGGHVMIGSRATDKKRASPSSGSCVARVSLVCRLANFHHQKIDRPRPSEFQNEEIQWLTDFDSTIIRRSFDERSTIIRRKDRIGKDRIGKDRIGWGLKSGKTESEKPNENPSEKPNLNKEPFNSGSNEPSLTPISENLPSQNSQTENQEQIRKATWEAYRTCYQFRYGVEPLRDAKINSQILQLTKRLGAETPSVVEFYLSIESPFYQREKHPVGLCLRDAEKLRTEMLTGDRDSWKKTRPKTFADQRQDALIEQIKKIERGEL